MENAKLIIVVPCYNEEEMLEYTTRELVEVIARLKSGGKMAEGKILYVDDGSRDSTWKLIERLSHEHVEVVGLKLAHNVGHQNALWAGLEWAAEHGDVTISIDADLQDDTRAIDEMMDAYALGADIVYGVRRERKTDSWFKRNTALFFYRLIRSMGEEVIYNHADFRLMSRRVLPRPVSTTTARSAWPASRNIRSRRCLRWPWRASLRFPSACCGGFT